MKLFTNCLMVLMLAASCAFAQASPEQEVKKLERAWLDAYEQHDEKAMNAIVADDFTITFPDGSTQTKAQIISSLGGLGHQAGRRRNSAPKRCRRACTATRWS